MQIARDVVAEQLLPAVETSQVGKRSREAAEQLASLNPDTFPLGFATGGALTILQRPDHLQDSGKGCYQNLSCFRCGHWPVRADIVVGMAFCQSACACLRTAMLVRGHL